TKVVRKDEHCARRAVGSKASTRSLSLSESPMKSVGDALIVADPGVSNNERAGHTCGASVIHTHTRTTKHTERTLDLGLRSKIGFSLCVSLCVCVCVCVCVYVCVR